jgi:hypothetical protein
METDAISATCPDWSRERKGRMEWAPSRSLLASIRSYQKSPTSRAPLGATRKGKRNFKTSILERGNGSRYTAQRKLGEG